jgi:hypothetical protein
MISHDNNIVQMSNTYLSSYQGDPTRVSQIPSSLAISETTISTSGIKSLSSTIVARRINGRNNGIHSDKLSIFYDTTADRSTIYDLMVMAYKLTGTESITGYYITQIV